MAANLSYEIFAELAHQRFTVTGPRGDVVLELERVTRLPARRSGGDSGFTLLFLGPRAAPLPQATYDFRHPRFTGAIFIVPVERTASEDRYEAVFNP